MIADDGNSAGAVSQPTDYDAAGSDSPRWNPPWKVWALISFAILVIVTVQITNVTADHAVDNIITAGFAFLALFIWMGWFGFYSRHAIWIRMLPVALFIFSISTFFVFYRIDHVSGELIPVFARRFSFHPDQLLPLPTQTSTAQEKNSPQLTPETPEDFPQFLGPDRTASITGIELVEDWQQSNPEQIWKQSIGAGWCAFSAVNGYAVTMEQRGASELTTCYDLMTGKIMWSHATPARYQNKLGGIGPRSTPTIHEGKVYSIGVTGTLNCLDGGDGSVIWAKNIPAEVGSTAAEDSEAVYYGRSNSPLIVDDLVVVSGGGTTNNGFYSLLAYDKETGEEKWRGGTDQISYASPSLVEICGIRQILSVNEQTVSGHDPLTGEMLWSHAWPGDNLSNSSSSQAVVIADDKVLLSKGYGTGAMLLRISRSDDGKWFTEKVWKKHNVLRTKFANVVVKDAHAFGLSDGILQCVEVATGRTRWKKGRYGHGQILLVGEKIVVLAENGTVHLVAANPQRYKELGKFKAIEGISWNNLCLYGPYLLVRNSKQAACFKLPAK